MSQNLEALERGQQFRVAGAKLRREIAGRPICEAHRALALLLLNPPPEIQRMRVGLLLRSLPYVGLAKVPRLLSQADISNPRMVVGPDHGEGKRPLTERQRQALVSLLMWRVA